MPVQKFLLYKVLLSAAVLLLQVKEVSKPEGIPPDFSDLLKGGEAG